MKFIEKDLGNYEKVLIIPISDSHIGDRHFNEEKLKKLVDDVLKIPHAYVVLIGDLIDNATKSSKSEGYNSTMNPQKQKHRAIDILKPIRHRILGATGGNHEERTYRESGQDISEDIAKALDVPYDPYGAFLHLHLGEKGSQMNYTLYMTHGTGGGGSVGNSINKVMSLRNPCLADIYMMGHVHKTAATNDEYFVPDTRHRRLTKCRRYYVLSGSYMEWGGYAERLMLSPSPTGFPVVELSSVKKKVTITI